MKKIYFFIGALLAAGAIQAQGPELHAVYDFNPNVKYAQGGITVKPMRSDVHGQDRVSHYTEDFTSGLGSWTPAIQAGPVGFALTTTGHSNSNGNTFIIPALMSSTPSQWVILDSDAGSTSYGVAEAATLTSGVIDISGTVDISTGDYVAFEFDQFFAEWQPSTGETEDHLFLGVSSDGSTWTEIEINEGVGREARPNPERVSWDISDAIDGTENSVYLRFRWEGDWNYGWQIDNIEIVDIPEKDLAIMDVWRGYSDGGLHYSQVPIAQADTVQIGAIIRNVGHLDQTNVTFDWVVTDPVGGTVSGTAGATLSLSNAEQDTILISTNYVPTMLGNYTMEWTVTSTEGDDVATNNTVTDAFYEITDATYATDYNEGAVEPINNWPNMIGEAYFGSVFDFVANDVVSAIKFKLTNEASIVGEEVLAKIYYFSPGGTEYLEGWSLPAGSFVIGAGDLGQWITLAVPNGYAVNTTDSYMILVGHYGNLTAPMYERQGDIAWNYIQGRDSDGANRGFFDRKAPLVRAYLGNDVSVEEEAFADQFSIYPNPANDVINVSVSLTGSENTTINVLDIAGKVIYSTNLGTVNGDKQVAISVDGMSSGVYFIEMVNSTSKEVKKFVKK